MRRDVLEFAPAALAHRMGQVAGTMRELADAMEGSARAIDRSLTLTARARRLELVTMAVRMRRATVRRS
jgi:hypothetical protein